MYYLGFFEELLKLFPLFSKPDILSKLPQQMVTLRERDNQAGMAGMPCSGSVAFPEFIFVF